MISYWRPDGVMATRESETYAQLDEGDSQASSRAILGSVGSVQKVGQEEAVRGVTRRGAAWSVRACEERVIATGWRQTTPTGHWDMVTHPINWKLIDTSNDHANANKLPTGNPSTQISSGPSIPPGVNTVVSQ